MNTKPKPDCTTCYFFKSFQDAYFDPLEPDDEGFCGNGKSPLHGNEGARLGCKCDEYEYDIIKSNQIEYNE